MTSINKLLRECTLGHGRIVCTCELTPEQIQLAMAEGRMHVTSAGFGFVLLPWNERCKKDPLSATEAVRTLGLVLPPPEGDGRLRF
jgi:hypothetical protein